MTLLNTEEETKWVLSILKKAAKKEILPQFGKSKGEIKSDIVNFLDLVTEADKSASQFILNSLRLRFPGSYSEEHKYLDRFNHDLIWQIDPIDGTQEFVEKYARGYTTLAALLEKGRDGLYTPISGIIYMPETDEAWYTINNQLIYSKGGVRYPIPRANINELQGYQRKVSPHPKLNQCYKEIHLGLKKPYHIILSGGSGSSVADLIMGKINLIVLNSNLAKDWDVGMAEPIIKSLGGFVCDFDGAPIKYNQETALGFDEPYLHRGVVMSIGFKKEEILPYLRKDLFVDRLKKT